MGGWGVGYLIAEFRVSGYPIISGKIGKFRIVYIKGNKSVYSTSGNPMESTGGIPDIIQDIAGATFGCLVVFRYSTSIYIGKLQSFNDKPSLHRA